MEKATRDIKVPRELALLWRHVTAVRSAERSCFVEAVRRFWTTQVCLFVEQYHQVFWLNKHDKTAGGQYKKTFFGPPSGRCSKDVTPRLTYAYTCLFFLSEIITCLYFFCWSCEREMLRGTSFRGSGLAHIGRTNISPSSSHGNSLSDFNDLNNNKCLPEQAFSPTAKTSWESF